MKTRSHLIHCTTMIFCHRFPNTSHDDVIKWKHFPHYWPFVRGIHRSFPTQRPVTRSFDVFFDLRLNKRLSKQSWGWWLETLSCSLWRQSNEANVVTTVLADAHASLIIIRQNLLRCVTEIIDDTRILLLGMIWCQQATRNNVDSIWRHWVTTGNRQALWHT